MIRLHLIRGFNNEGVYLYLPATPQEVGEAYALLDSISDDPSGTRILEIHSGIDMQFEINAAELNDAGKILGDREALELRLGMEEENGFASQTFGGL